MDTFADPFGGFGPLSSADADQPHIRYTSDGTYEIEFPGYGWHEYSSRPDVDIRFRGSRAEGYRYSELSSWIDGWGGRYGYFAVGIPTPEGAVPVTGSASYSGVVTGSTDIIVPGTSGSATYAPISGTVDLGFNFAQGSLIGAITLMLDGSTSLGSFSFRDTVFSVGSTTYSGAFDTSAAGHNYFLGRFTGPNGEETIGAWALPFVFNRGSSTLPADNQPHQAFGAWIARRNP